METKTKNQDQATQQMGSGEFREFFIDQLKDIYWAEKALHKALPELMAASTSKKLAQAFEKHTKETAEQIKIDEQVFELLGEKPEGKKCDAMEGLIKEANSVIKDTEKDSYTRDAGLILAAQKVEHYEIASYGTLVIFAKDMGEPEVAKLLQQILDNEKETDVTLTKVAEEYVNERAAME
ncbi:YciE/YciF ferroxidase family protein [Parabacteroides pacaensis]|uniref:YciE/YciF ferroxidase family protein n=1 Tax=Parabacteroides pacaensis TaxID=2086575 RepID=UPI000D0F61CE|nr:ferritin-like domain-containing protein [Parabacteroides pacaensis]